MFTFTPLKNKFSEVLMKLKTLFFTIFIITVIVFQNQTVCIIVCKSIFTEKTKTYFYCEKNS